MNFQRKDAKGAKFFLDETLSSFSAENRYSHPIETVPENHPLRGQSLNINGDSGIGCNPDRYRQHGFYFNVDNCIACHACESACSEKNDLPPHLAFRAVGYLEGGVFPDYQRLNISMACNHCDDPVCLKGCPTRAYTKFAEYGAVLQDPDVCFGCGYCTWVCPYNAPQLDPVKGRVEKCNMCVDRLEAGLKPACASACLAGALDFGVIDTTSENRERLEVAIPGFPDPAITRPNIRFQQTRSLPRELTRPDAMPLRYVRDGRDEYSVKLRRDNQERAWNLKGLRSREDPLVVFTLISQGAVGAFLVMFFGPMFGLEALSPASHPSVYTAFLFALLGLETVALTLSTLHLGKPGRFYRAFNNLRYSPVSREVAGIAVFYNLLLANALLSAFPAFFGGWSAAALDGLRTALGWGAAVSGMAALYFMQRIYRIPARPFWNHWQALTAFYGNMLTLGGFVVGLVYAATLQAQGENYTGLMQVLAVPVVLGLVLEGIGLLFHARALVRGMGEGVASHHVQRTTFGKTYLARNAGLAAGAIMVSALAASGVDGWMGIAAWTVVATLILATAIVGRALFYVLVIPTTMPGAFFWRNPGFRQHAVNTGLARMPQVGIAAERC